MGKSENTCRCNSPFPIHLGNMLIAEKDIEDYK